MQTLGIVEKKDLDSFTIILVKVAVTVQDILVGLWLLVVRMFASG